MKIKITAVLVFLLLASFLTVPQTHAERSSAVDEVSKRNKKFYEAIDNGKTSKLTYLLKKGVDINAIDYKNVDGFTPLTYAVKNSDARIIAYLITNGADVNIVNRDGWSPLMYAANVCNDDIVNALLKEGAEVNYTVSEGGDTGWSAFYLSTRNNCTSTSDKLVKNHAKVIPSLLQHLVDEKRDAISYILDHLPFSDVLVGSDPILIYLTKLGKTGLVRKVVHKGADVNLVNSRKGWPALMFAVRDGHHEIVRILINNGALVNFEDQDKKSPMFLAAHYNHVDIGDLLLENYADTDKPFLMAETIKMMDFLVERGGDVNSKDKDGLTPVIMAARDGKIDTLRYLIEESGDVKLKTNTGVTALHYAAEHSFDGICKLLIAYGANVDAMDDKGNTVLMSAVAYGHKDIVILLLQNSVNIHAKDNSGTTPLMHASSNGHAEIAELLIKKGASVHDKDNSGATALMAASVYGQAEAASVLLDNGANVDAKDNSGTSILTGAVKNDQTTIVNLLIENGADATIKDNDDYAPNYFARNNEIKMLLIAALKRAEDKSSREGDLPVELRRDKYMRMITSHMADEKYAEALPYFDKLYGMDIELEDDSLTYYYAEALYKTGNMELSLSKLYEYMKKVGKDGAHYMKAIDLSNKIENQL
ncbi:MAG: ankyrin repeat domain-containing protein [Thermodesulfobacteriota bacterium]